MRYFEVLPADSRYKGNEALTYEFEDELKPLAMVRIPLRSRLVTGLITHEVKKPSFKTKPIKDPISRYSLPKHLIKLAEWMRDYYLISLGEALKQFFPATAAKAKSQELEVSDSYLSQLELSQPLTDDQKQAISKIKLHKGTTVLLHGDTGTGKTRVYMELAKETLKDGKSVILLTPEIALTTQLAASVEKMLHSPTYILHSQLTPARRRKIWTSILEANEPVVIIGPRSALFSPVQKLGLIVVDEAHEPSYKQEQSPRYHASRVASQLGVLTGAKVILGTATPLLTDYFVASAHGAVIEMKKPAASKQKVKALTKIIDMKQRQSFTKHPYLSNFLIDEIFATVAAKKQVLIYLNRRGSARLILCTSCGWQELCPNCDVPLVYHSDEHLVRCHNCGHKDRPPKQCPTCSNPDIIYKGIGTKALSESISKLFPGSKVQRFDSDNLVGERVNELYPSLLRGEIDIIVGTQLLAKGFDLPKLGLVGVVAAESSLGLPDFSAEERAFQLLYQVIGRVGRGHGKGTVVIQCYNPANPVLDAAVKRNWQSFYKYVLSERQKYRFPPASFLLQLVCNRATLKGAQNASEKLKRRLVEQKLPVEIIGPMPSFFARRGRNYYWQIVVKSKDRNHLLKLASIAPSDWAINLDPVDLL